MTETEALNLAKTGDENGFNFLYETYKKQVLYVLAHKTHNDALIKDLSQITWLKVYKNLSKYNGDCALKTWISKIAHNSYIDHYRANLRWNSLDELQENGYFDFTEIPEENEAELAETIKEKLEGISEILKTLPEPHRKVLQLFSDGIECKAIGERLKIPTGTVLSRMYYARKKIKKYLEEPKPEKSIEEIGRKFNNA